VEKVRNEPYQSTNRGRAIYLQINGASMKIITIIPVLAAICVLPALADDYTADYWAFQGASQELDLSNDAYWNGKGVALANMGRFDEAIACFDRAIELNSSFAEAWNFKGLALSVGQGKYDEGIACFDNALQINSAYYDAWTSRGMALANAERLDESLISFERAVQINPRDPKGWNNKGVVQMYMGGYQDALASFDKAIELDPTYGVAWNNKGLALQDMEDTPDAEAAFARARELGAI
jgi:tetratricopeptide (TPR) repeat protein